MKGMEVDVLGPTMPRRAHVLPGQRYPGDSKQGLDHLLPLGLGKEAHLRAAMALPSPFTPSDWPELDVVYVIREFSIWQEFWPAHARLLREELENVAKAVQRLQTQLDLSRGSSSKRVTMQKQPAFMGAMTSLLR